MLIWLDLSKFEACRSMFSACRSLELVQGEDAGAKKGASGSFWSASGCLRDASGRLSGACGFAALTRLRQFAATRVDTMTLRGVESRLVTF